MSARTFDNDLSVREAAQLLGCSAQTIRARVRAGRLDAYRADHGRGQLRISLEAIAATIEPVHRPTPKPVPHADHH